MEQVSIWASSRKIYHDLLFSVGGICVHVYIDVLAVHTVAKGECQAFPSINFCLTSLRQALSLNLELDWYPVSPNDPVSIPNR